MRASVLAVSRSKSHSFSKAGEFSIRLLSGLGVEGDAHLGVTVKHRYHAAKNPDAPNLRQVHLIHAELFDELREKGFTITPGAIGENVTTRGIDLLALPCGARLRLGEEAIVEVTGLRSPCTYIDRYQSGLKNAVLDKDADGRVIRKSGIMAIVIAGGDVRSGDAITVELPTGAHRPLSPV